MLRAAAGAGRGAARAGLARARAGAAGGAGAWARASAAAAQVGGGMEACALAWKDELFKAGKEGAGADWTRMDALVTSDFRFVRPTGNPLSMDGFKAMMASPGMAFESSDIVSVNKVHEGADSGIVCFTSHDKFTFQGNPNDDICVMTFYLVKDAAAEHGWKVLWGQRSSGRTPDEDKPSGF